MKFGRFKCSFTVCSFAVVFFVFTPFISNKSFIYLFFLIFSSQVPNEDEMIGYTHNSNTQGDSNTNQSESTTSDDTITDRQQQVK